MALANKGGPYMRSDATGRARDGGNGFVNLLHGSEARLPQHRADEGRSKLVSTSWLFVAFDTLLKIAKHFSSAVVIASS
jgi:hypothetical protein